MGNASIRHKHVQIDQQKLSRAKRTLRARTETETLDRALDLVLAESSVDTVLRKVAGKGKIRRVFP